MLLFNFACTFEKKLKHKLSIDILYVCFISETNSIFGGLGMFYRCSGLLRTYGGLWNWRHYQNWIFSFSLLTALTGPLPAVWRQCGCAWCTVILVLCNRLCTFASPDQNSNPIYLFNKVIDSISMSRPIPTSAQSRCSFSNVIHTEKRHSIVVKRARSLETDSQDPNLGSVSY